MKSSAIHRLCPSLGHGDEVLTFDEAERGRELAHPFPPLRPGDGAEGERAGKIGRTLDRDDRRAVDPLAELPRVDLDERGERCARREELARERLPRRTGAPDDRGTPEGEE